jgi:ion channel-forming bestrophin family protein
MNDRSPSLATLFSLNSTLGRILLYSLLMSLYSGLAVLKEHSRFAGYGVVHSTVHAILGLMVSMLLVFRTNGAYAKWWEARTLWGALINASRNLALKVRHFVPATIEERQQMANLLAVFARTLRDHLRRINDLKRVPGFEDLEEDPNHPPGIVASRIYALIQSWRGRNLISDQMTRVLDTEGKVLMDVCGGCERILNTRLAFSYRIFVNKCVFLYVLTLPWGLVEDFHGWTIPMVFVVSFLMIGLEIVAYSVESPFGHEADDLDLDGMCATLERSVHEIMVS